MSDRVWLEASRVRVLTRGFVAFLIGSLLVLSTAVAFSVSASAASQQRSSENWVGLPDGLDPLDVPAMLRISETQARGVPAGTPLPVDQEGVGPAFQIGGEPVYGPAADEQQFPDVAFDGTNYLVVWGDFRTGSYRTDIFAARVDTSGAVLDSVGILVCAAQDNQSRPTVAFDGTHYLVVWEDRRNGSDYDIYGARIDTSGTVLDPDGMAISTETGDQDRTAVAFDGTRFFVVWQDYRSGTQRDIYGARVDTSGVVIDAAGVPVCTATGSRAIPAIVFNGTHYFVVWGDGRGATGDVYGTRVDTSATVLDGDGIAISTANYNQHTPSVSFDGTYHLVAWKDFRSGSMTNADVYAARVDTAGVVRDPSGILVDMTGNDNSDVDVAFDGTNYLLTWHDRFSSLSDIQGARVDTSGAVLDATPIDVCSASGAQFYPAITFGATTYFVVFSDLRGEDADIYGLRMDTSGNVMDGDGKILSTSVSSQSGVAAAYGSTKYLVVWEEVRGASGYDIRGVRVDPSGAVLDATSIGISTGSYNQTSPDVAFDGINYFVVWQDDSNGDSDVYGARVDTNGVVLDVSGISIAALSDNEWLPAVAFDGTNYLVVWEDDRSGDSEIYGTRVSTDGTVLDFGGTPIATGDYWYSPDVAFDGTNYLVVWCGGSNDDIVGARVDTLGGVIDVGGIAIYSADYEQSFPAVAFGGDDYMVVWEDERSSYELDIYGARVDTSGAVLDAGGIAISAAAEDQQNAAVAFDGANYVILWDDWRSVTESDIYAARVNASGTLLDADGMEISSASYNQLMPAVTPGPHCVLLIAYASFTPVPYNTFQIWGNRWAGPTNLSFASASAVAGSGHVTLSWQMGVDVDASDFVVERAESPEGDFLALTLPICEGPGLQFSCTDYSVVSGKTYWYRIVLNGVSGPEIYGPIEVHVSAVPAVTRLLQSFPNPFNPFCTISYHVSHARRVTLRVFDVEGSAVRTLVEAWREPGVYSVVWDGKGDGGERLPSGVYFYTLEARDLKETKKAVLLR
ncbi:MAG: hypothetical protein AMJ46_10070 [Latescibacteria bacterium DG_63]|nr:MAG: hypothetical protein AMJ46_10070 [Latescibacteria bacterium DG_63]